MQLSFCFHVQVKWLHAMKKGCHPRALHDACINGHVEVADWLYENCSACQEWNQEQPGSRLLTFLGSWSDCGYFCGRWRATLPPPAPLGLKMLNWLLEKYELADALYHLLAYAVIAGDEVCFEFLMSQPEEFHQAARQSTSGVPPLMRLAVKYGRVDMLPALSKFTGALILASRMLTLALCPPTTYCHSSNKPSDLGYSASVVMQDLICMPTFCFTEQCVSLQQGQYTIL